MEQYFKVTKVLDGKQVSLVGMYLVGDAKLWWKTRQDDDARAGRTTFNSWPELKELREQFLPCNTSWEARVTLKKLKHTGTVQDYVKEFTSLLLNVKDMPENDKLFNFLSCLQNWAQIKVKRQGAKNLKTAMAIVESLVNLWSSLTQEGYKSKFHPKETKFEKKTFKKEVIRKSFIVKLRKEKTRVETKQNRDKHSSD